MGKLLPTLWLLLSAGLAGPALAQDSEFIPRRETPPRASARPVAPGRAGPIRVTRDPRAPGPGYHGGGYRWGGYPGLAILPLVGGALLAAPGIAAPPPDVPPDEPPPPRRRLQPQAPAPRLLARAAPPPPGENRYRPGELLVETRPGATPAAIALILRRHRLSEAEAATFTLTGASMRLWRIQGPRDVGGVIRELSNEPAIASLQPNYLYRPSDDAAPAAPLAPSQYALDKMHVDASLDQAAGEPIKVALIDTAIDEAHPDLAGAVAARFDAIGGAGVTHSLDHGTAMAGAIAARGRLRGVASTVKLLSARAFDTDGAGGALGSSFSVMKGLDWAAHAGARVVNMSFAGPRDPALHDLLTAAAKKGLILVSAMGNAGPKSPPLYPGADENVIAITATDAEDRLYAMANVGAYVAVAAPGVDVLLPAPQGAYSLETGTSVSSALVSGVVALLLERQPKATPAEIRKWLTATARPVGAGPDKAALGAGIVDAHDAVNAAGL